MAGWVDLGYPVMHQPGVELVIFRSLVQLPNHYTTEPPMVTFRKQVGYKCRFWLQAAWMCKNTAKLVEIHGKIAGFHGRREFFTDSAQFRPILSYPWNRELSWCVCIGCLLVHCRTSKQEHRRLSFSRSFDTSDTNVYLPSIVDELRSEDYDEDILPFFQRISVSGEEMSGVGAASLTQNYFGFLTD